MPCVQRKLVALAACAAVLLTAFAPRESFAASTCECFCGAVGSGAVSADTMTQEQCKETCDALSGNWQYVGCFTDTAQYPVESDKCWTKEECESWSDERSGGEIVTAEWGSVFPADCAKTKTSQEEMHYCYANDVPYDLNIALGNVTEVQNLPAYINAVYTWLLPAASLVAVVMMMIGGLQYTLARGKSKYIEKAKTRITNAITGIVILLSAFVILNLIDPRLVSFDALKIPLVKEVTILDAMSSCERLSDVGYGIDPDPETTKHYCGETGTISSTGGLKDNAIGSWEDGDVCKFQTCELGNGFTCLSSGECASCADVPTPSSATCAALESLNSGTNGEEQTYCRFDAESNSCLGVTSDAQVSSFYCPSMRTWSERSEENRGCEYYETLSITYDGTSETISSEKGKELLEEICNNDPCGLAENVGATRCAYNEGTDVTEWFWGAYTSTTDGFHCHTF
jgi:hypothetical protein